MFPQSTGDPRAAPANPTGGGRRHCRPSDSYGECDADRDFDANPAGHRHASRDSYSHTFDYSYSKTRHVDAVAGAADTDRNQDRASVSIIPRSRAAGRLPSD